MSAGVSETAMPHSARIRFLAWAVSSSPPTMAPYPWWDPDRPASQEYFKKHPEELGKFQDDREEEEDLDSEK